ncbi:methylamine utilization protein [Planctomycetes bacterium K23_9]|uniref:Methylamine utilization protein n=1 Tax=Stieleria marina TaxID=1930275 RepID=A0A517NNC7_9BACT|nr:hypothetical protein K239x_05690 [Planctomycetes bacterium K23_9]
MKLIHLLLALPIVITFGDHSLANETGDLKITFKLRGQAPSPMPIALPRPLRGNITSVDESLVVDPKTNGIKNVVVYVYTGRRGTKLPPQPARKRMFRLSARNGRLEPHIVLLQAGDTMRFRNFDPVGYNLNVPAFNNPPRGAVLPPNGNNDFKFPRSEPALLPVACNIHPWISAFVLVVDHTFFAKSDAEGVLEIKGLPAGEEIVFRAWHERGTFKNQIFINDKEDAWKSNKFKLAIKPGMNDLGVVETPLNQF